MVSSHTRSAVDSHVDSEHPNAASMLDSALATHSREARAISARSEGASSSRAGPQHALAHAGSEHPSAASMLDAALADHYALPAAASGPQLSPGAGAGAVDPAFAQAGSEHPVAAGMVAAALRGHASDAPHDVFGLEH